MPEETHQDGHPRVHIEINRAEYSSPTPTTGEALYALGDIPAHQELFHEEEGTTGDEAIPRGGTTVAVKNGDHFYSEKLFKVFVNTREKEVAGPTADYETIVRAAYPVKPEGQQGDEYLVLYSRGPRRNPEGTLLPKQNVQLKNGMIFDVTPADKS